MLIEFFAEHSIKLFCIARTVKPNNRLNSVIVRNFVFSTNRLGEVNQNTHSRKLFVPSKVNNRSDYMRIFTRGFAFDQTICEGGNKKKGLVLGAFFGCNGVTKLTDTATKFNESVSNRLVELIVGSKMDIPGKTLLFHNLNEDFYAVVLTAAGFEGSGISPDEYINDCKENIRIAASAGCKLLQDKLCIPIINVDGYTNAEAAAEGVNLGCWKFEQYKSNKSTMSQFELFDNPDGEGWHKGTVKAKGQNLARCMTESPSNIMTPEAFVRMCLELLCPCGVQCDVRDKYWMTEKDLVGILAFARGSCNTPYVLELAYCGGAEEDKPVVLIGKGTTFDSGGVCLKSPEELKHGKSDMAGGAIIAGAMKAIAQLGVPINVNAFIPLLESMPGGSALKPGDVVVALNGKTIKVENTRHEGRVLLADALVYSKNYMPCLTITLSKEAKGVQEAIGSSATGAYATSDVVWDELKRAGVETGDRVWRFPLWKTFTSRVTDFADVDTHNVGRGAGGSSSLGAAFLMEFAPPVDFLLLDITGTCTQSGGEPPYLRKGCMTGRPTRTLIQFLSQMACPLDQSSPC